MLGAVFVGGCAGGLARYEVLRAWPTGAGGFPWATLAVNDLGALLLALLLSQLSVAPASAAYLRPLLGSGFCGAFTTFSSIVVSADQLVARGDALLGGSYLLASAAGGLAAAWLGWVLGRSAPARDA